MLRPRYAGCRLESHGFCTYLKAQRLWVKWLWRIMPRMMATAGE